MAQAAKDGKVAADMKPVDYRGAFKRLTTIDAMKAKQQKAAKDIGDVFSACEGIHGVDKAAAKIFMILRKLDDNDRILTFRDLNGLLDASGLPKTGADLVDRAEGNIVDFRPGKGKPEVEDEGDGTIEEEIEDLENDVDGTSGDEDDFEEASDEELAQQAGRAEAAAKNRAKDAMSGGEEPYTGDNSDLADDAE